VIREVRQRPVKGFVHQHRLLPHRDRRGQLTVGQILERGRSASHPACHFAINSRASPRAVRILRLACARLFAVRREEIREPRSQIARQMPADDRDGVAVMVSGGRQIRVAELGDGRLGKRLVAQELVLIDSTIVVIAHRILPEAAAASTAFANEARPCLDTWILTPDTNPAIAVAALQLIAR
jgi:hypothetical protein